MQPKGKETKDFQREHKKKQKDLMETRLQGYQGLNPTG
jgi:hypothetical protein